MNVTVAASQSLLWVEVIHCKCRVGFWHCLLQELSLLIEQQTIYFRNGRFTWNNAIPEQEVHLKLGGDAGGGTFKMPFQIAKS